MRTKVSYAFLAFAAFGFIDEIASRIWGRAVSLVESIVGVEAYPYVIGGFIGSVLAGGLMHLAWLYDSWSEKRFRAMSDDLLETANMLDKAAPSRSEDAQAKLDFALVSRTNIVLDNLRRVNIKCSPSTLLGAKDSPRRVRNLALYLGNMAEFSKRGMLNSAQRYAKKNQVALGESATPNSATSPQ